MWHDRITTKEREGEGSVVAPALCPRGVKKLEYEFHFVKFLLIFGRCSRHRQEAFGMEGRRRKRNEDKPKNGSIESPNSSWDLALTDIYKSSLCLLPKQTNLYLREFVKHLSNPFPDAPFLTRAKGGRALHGCQIAGMAKGEEV